jgi:hypothetical protein
MRLNQLLVLVFLPVLASGVASAVQCKVQGEVEIGRCVIGGLLAGIVSVIFVFIGFAIGGGS